MASMWMGQSDDVRQHGDSSSLCEDAPIDDGASPECDGRMSHHGPLECAVSSDRAGRAHLPKDIPGVGAVLKDDFRGDGADEG